MADLLHPRFPLRRSPKQARSAQLLKDILEAAAQVLAREGAHRFTSARVAERAGVSVGSLYQYFPSKEAILFRLQTEEWDQNGGKLRGILADRTLSPHERLRKMIQDFFASEYDERALRLAFSDRICPRYLDAPEAQESRLSGAQAMRIFMREALPSCSEQQRSTAAEMIFTSMQSIAERVSTENHSRAEIDERACATADMACAYLSSLEALETAPSA